YGFHTIHGRAPAIATGVKLGNPELDVWIITGDGDALSIGGNHTMHVLRRNLDCQILLFNNEIYGLTKGQYSPTSRVGTRSPSTPFGSVDRPVTPCAFALGSGARFIARGIDVHKNLPEVLKAAHGHRGASFVEIFQNCIVYNDDVFASFTEKEAAQQKQLWLKPGERMLFSGGAKGIALDTERLAAMAASSPVPPPASCDAERAAIADEMATINAHYTVPRPQFGPLGTRYVQISEQLTALMRADQPDLVKIEKLWRETDRLRLQLRANSINADTQCKLDELKLMPV